MRKELNVLYLDGNRFRVSLAGSDVAFFSDKAEEGHPVSDPDPLDLLLSSLGTCVGLFAKNYCVQHNRSFSRLSTVTSGELSQDTPTRLINIKVRVDTDAAVRQDPERDVFLRFIRACIVHSTIINTKEVDIDLL